MMCAKIKSYPQVDFATQSVGEPQENYCGSKRIIGLRRKGKCHDMNHA